MVLLLGIVLTALIVSALCSLLEATLLSSSNAELTRRTEQGETGAARLLHLKEHHLEDSISAILTYNTIAHTIGAALAGAQAAIVFGDAWVGLFSAILTLMILVFTEILPKTLGTVYASRFASFASACIAIMIKPPMKWLLFFTRFLTRLVARDKPTGTTRGDIVAMVKIAERDGNILSQQSMVISNFLRFDDISVDDIMTPRTVITMFNAAASVDQLLDDPDCRSFSRIPVYADEPDNILGYVLMREILQVALDPAQRSRKLEEFLRPIAVIDETTTVFQALKKLTEESEHLAIVLDDFGVLSGLLSLEDLFETALGVEIVDELDQVVDLRKQALELREKRLHRVRELRRRSALLEKPTKADPS